ncbi:nucleoside-diphosphate-sugar epimerase [Natronobacillus azotifigens]|uniref:SDR family NAD(P)-dependent oxidoreductase n=1 Tax=Natronobacillus azotifigens TaxID=472978 RepID=A0A9J6RB86_9BACI|nr:SDR family NAD(P)-dependent oxidoreductase [Natronobacillus azotifigens]MCZ0702944.1 SDR family NAD(P)-dependent oxidoreductase [Natronobacillus azotifigens]
MKKALVLGATGGIGYALVQALLEKNIAVIAFGRGEEKLERYFGNKVKMVVGDVLQEADVMRAAEGVDVIFHAVNFPYQHWMEKHPICLQHVIHAAKSKKTKVVLIDNIYAYGKQTRKVSEQETKEPHTKKGKIRLDLESKLKASGVPSLIVHLPDFYGPYAYNTILHETLKNVAINKKANFVGPLNVAREFVFTPDAAKIIVQLSQHDDAYDQNWNIPAIHSITGAELVKILREETDYRKKIRPISKTMIRFIGFFQPYMKEVVEMMYLTEEPVILNGEKLQKQMGEIPFTSYRNGLIETIEWIKQEESVLSK